MVEIIFMKHNNNTEYGIPSKGPTISHYLLTCHGVYRAVCGSFQRCLDIISQV